MSIAIGVACVGGYLGVTAAIAYVQNLGTYSSTPPTTGPVNNWAGGTEKFEEHLIKHGGSMSAAQYYQKASKVLEKAENYGLQPNGRYLLQKDNWLAVIDESGKFVSSFPHNPTITGRTSALEYLSSKVIQVVNLR